MSKPARRTDEILFPKSSLKTGDSTYGTLREECSFIIIAAQLDKK